MFCPLAFWLLLNAGGPQASRQDPSAIAAREQSPADAQALAVAGVKLASQRRLREARILFEKALRLDPDDFITRRNLAASQWELGDLNASRRNLELILKTKPSDPQSIMLLGLVSENLKDYSRGAVLLSSVPDLIRTQPKYAAALARCYYRTGQPEQARSALRIMEGPQAILWAGDIALANGDYETAERFWRSIESIYPDRAALGYRFAKASLLSIRIEESQKMILGLIASGIRSTDLYNLLAWCYERQDRMEDAIKAMNEAIALEPAREGNYLDLATILETQKLYKPAIEAAQRAVALAPRSLPAYELKAFLETKVYASFKPARRTFDEAIAQMPNSPEPLRALAHLQCDLHMPKDAAATFESALKRFPRNALLYQDYARMLLSPDGGGDDAARARATRLLETALRLDDSLAEVHYEMGRIALDENRFADALPHLARAAELDPSNSKIHHMLGRVYRVMGRPADLAREMELFQKLKREEENIPSGIRSRQ